MATTSTRIFTQGEWIQDMTVETDPEGVPVITIVAAGEFPSEPTGYAWKSWAGFLYLYLWFEEDHTTAPALCPVLDSCPVRDLFRLQDRTPVLRVTDARGHQQTIGLPDTAQLAEARNCWS